MSFQDWHGEIARPSKSKPFYFQGMESLQTLVMPLSHKATPVQLWLRDLLRRQASTLRFPNPQPKILEFLSHFQELRQQMFRNRPNRNQIGISKVSDGSWNCEQQIQFANNKHSKSGSGIGFETFCVIFNHHIITKPKLWTKVPCQSQNSKLSPLKKLHFKYLKC